MLNKEERKFLCTNLSSNEDQWDFLCLLFKVHKVPLKTRPVVLYCRNLLHTLGQLITEWLKPLDRMYKYYFKDSFTLKKELDLQKYHQTPASSFVMQSSFAQTSKQARPFTASDGSPSITRDIWLSHPWSWWTHYAFSWQITSSNLETHIGYRRREKWRERHQCPLCPQSSLASMKRKCLLSLETVFNRIIILATTF